MHATSFSKTTQKWKKRHRLDAHHAQRKEQKGKVAGNRIIKVPNAANHIIYVCPAPANLCNYPSSKKKCRPKTKPKPKPSTQITTMEAKRKKRKGETLSFNNDSTNPILSSTIIQGTHTRTPIHNRSSYHNDPDSSSIAHTT